METDNKVTSHEEIEKMLEKNAELLTENNKLLKKIHRSGVWGIWIRVAWYTLLLGLPFVLFYVFESYFTALGSSFEMFNAGMHELPGLKQINQVFDNVQ